MTTEPFNIDLLPKAQKDLKALRPYTDQATREIWTLRDNPYRGEAKKGSLRGVRALSFFLPGRGEYRALYVTIHDTRTCSVFMVAAHEGIYNKAKRRYEALKKLGRVS